MSSASGMINGNGSSLVPAVGTPNTLTESDYRKLEASFITRELAGRARIVRVDSQDGAELVGRKSKAGVNYAGLVFPYIWPGEVRLGEVRLRRDQPDLEQQPDGTVKETAKYLSPPGRGNLLYFPPGTPPNFLADVAVPLVITEGEKKTLALSRFFSERGIERLIIGLPGVWNWRGTVGAERDSDGHIVALIKGVIPQLDKVEWKERKVWIVFDANAATNESVAAARRGLVKELTRRGAIVFLVNLPLDIPGVNGVDDLLVAKGGDFVADLFNKASIAQSTKPKSAGDVPPICDICMTDVRAEKVEWLWEGRIPLHSITIIEGIEGVGKSTLLCAITAAVTLGRGLPGMANCEPGNVVWLSAEDDLARVLKPRLQAAGADCDRVFAVGDPFTFDQQGEMALKEIVANREPKLVIIDPIFAYTKGDANKGGDSRALTNMLKILAENFACAVALVRHVGKSKGLGDPRAAGLYSIEWRAASRSVLLVGCDPDDQQKRAITQTKCNFGPNVESIGYTIKPDSDSPSGARFFWTGTSDLTAERILETVGKVERDAGETNAKEDAEEFLQAVLGSGMMLTTDVEKEAKEAKISTATLRRAKDSLGIKSRSRGFGKDKKWYWILPEDLNASLDAQPDAKVLTISENEQLRANRTDKSNYVNEFGLGAHPEVNERLSRVSEHLSNTAHLFEGNFTDPNSSEAASENDILNAIAE